MATTLRRLTLATLAALLLPAAAGAATPEVRQVEPSCGAPAPYPIRLPPGGDASLTAAEAKALGLAALDHRWTLEELRQAGPILVRLAAEAPERLPRAGSVRSGELFTHLVDAAPLAAFADAARPVDARFQEAGSWFGAYQPVAQLFTGLTAASGRFQRETAELSAAALRVGGVLLDLSGPFLARFPAEDPSRPVREEGLQRVRNGALAMTLGLLQVLELDRSALGPGELAATSGAVRAALLDAWPRLEPAGKGLVVAKLEQLASLEPAGSALRGDLAALAAKLRGRAGEEGFTVGPLPPALAARAATGSPWRRCGVPGGGAEVELPAPTSGLTMAGADQPGAPTFTGLLGAVDAFGTSYRAIRFEGGREFASLEQRAQGLAEAVAAGGKVERRRVQAGAAEAWELVVTGAERSNVVRLFDAGGAHFMAMVEYPAAMEPLARPRVRRFLDSFAPAAPEGGPAGK